ncbi:hypothetical protein HNR46_001614 [Haloferula luteola]|uniref:RecT family protein n=1 Tax=Haloferula luteola TaxID=595692 RepID=A0A840V9K5_9BACT|nr:hypothetical protein [Haloferula luteola]MBB5351378.1 hypothetical protein [Haloferula luteola]
MQTLSKSPADLAPYQPSSEFPSTGLSIFDSGAFERLYQVAHALAASSLVPKTLCEDKSGPYSPEKIAANCLRVVEQASRWQLSPFAVLDCASVVHGRLMWEGKLVASVIDAKLGIRLDYEYSGSGKQKKVVVSGHFPDEDNPRTIEGTVAQWETTGNGSPWANPDNWERQLAYRGAREWARRHAPAVMLGVYSPDEFEPEPMRDVTPRRAITRKQAIDPQAEIVPNEAEGGVEGGRQVAEAKAENPAQIHPNPSITPASGRQKKDRIHRDGRFRSLSEKQTESGNPFWVANFNIGGKSIDLSTFSSSLGEDLSRLDQGTAVRLTITSSTKGQFTLEDYQLLENSNAEGDLL